MRLVSIDAVKPGMRLGRPIYRFDDGKILLRANIQLSSFYIRRLRDLHFNYLYILEPEDIFEETLNLEPIRQETRVKASLAVVEMMNGVQYPSNIHVNKLKQVVGEMIDQIFGNTDVVYNMLDIRSYDSYTYAHSVNVCTISLIIGTALKLSRSDLEYLGIGALLHDIGKMFVDSRILNKPGSLEPDEYEQVKKHTRDGYELLKDKICISFISSHVAFQHHEREDGSGYPRGLTGDRIHRFAKIVAVADVYDAMTSQRVYRKAIPSHVVLQEIKENADRKFDRSIVEHLEKIVAPYPIGSVLLLNNGEKVVVDNVSKLECTVRVISGRRKGLTFNLYQQMHLSVLENIS